MKTLAWSKNGLCFGLLIVSIGLSGCGCGTIIGGAFEALDYNNKVDYYEDRGYSERQARQNASDDQALERMDEKLTTP